MSPCPFYIVMRGQMCQPGHTIVVEGQMCHPGHTTVMGRQMCHPGPTILMEDRCVTLVIL